MSRIPLIEIEELTPLQLEHFRNRPVGKLDLFRILAHAGTIYPGFTAYSEAIFSGLAISAHDRELVILAVSHVDGGEYEWIQHEQIARSIGVEAGKIEAISRGEFSNPVFSAFEQALLKFTQDVIDKVQIDDRTFDDLARSYSHRQIVETIFVIGCYMTIVRISEVAQLQVDAVHGLEIAQDAMRRGGREV